MDSPDRSTSLELARETSGPGPVTAQQMLERLKSAGIYLTAQRRVIISVISRRLHTFSVSGLSTEPALRRISLVCIYRNLLLLEKINLVKRSFTRRGGFLFQVQQPGFPASITVACRNCGTRETIPDAGIARIRQEFARRGYSSVEHLAEFAGLCPECARASSRLEPAPSATYRPAQLRPGDTPGADAEPPVILPHHFSAGCLEYSTAGE